jgi:hypothetical protein
VVVATALTHAVVCRCRSLHSNQISTIASGAFSGLTALRILYDAGLLVGLFLLLAAWCLHVSEALRVIFFRTYFRPASFWNCIITSFCLFSLS